MITFVATSNAQSGTSTSTTLTWTGSPNTPPPGNMLIAVFGFEGVAPGSGPWVADAGGATGWDRLLYQDPDATGCGLEVWNTNQWSTGPTTTFNFDASRVYVARGAQYLGNLADIGVVRAHSEQAWTGDNPEAPSIYAFASEMVVAVSAIQLASPGYDPPDGWTQRFDNARSSFGNVEITLIDQLAATEGATGAITWTAVAAGTEEGATGVFAIRPADSPAIQTSPMITIEYPAS